MSTLEEKQDFILNHEKDFARKLASRLIEKPELNIWMILVPVFFVYFFHRLNKVKSGRSEFVIHYLSTRQSILQETKEALEEEREADYDELCQQNVVPNEAKSTFTNWSLHLSGHYHLLLKSEGDNHQDLIRQAYKNRRQYQDFVKRLNRAEKEMEQALLPSLDSTQEIIESMNLIRKLTIALRDSYSENVFSNQAPVS